MDTNLPVDSAFSEKVIEKIKSLGFTKSFAEDEAILSEDSYIKAIPIVTKGSIRVMRSDEDGKEILLYYIKAGETCIMSFLGGLHDDTSKVSAIAVEDSEVLFIPVAKLNYLSEEVPEWRSYIFKLYHRRFEELLDVVNAIAFKNLDERLLDWIQKKSSLLKSTTLSITHEQLANELGTSRVVVSRLLKQMENEGLIELGRNKLHLLSKTS